MERQPRIHPLKILRVYFEEILKGTKQFELRKNDRDFHVGDLLMLMEIPTLSSVFTGRRAICEVTYVLKDCPEYGLMPGYTVLGIKLRGDLDYDEVWNQWVDGMKS